MKVKTKIKAGIRTVEVPDLGTVVSVSLNTRDGFTLF